MTPCEAFKEIGVKDGENGFILDFDMNNVDVNKIYESHLKFKYEPPKDNWNELLVHDKNTYFEEMRKMVKLRCIKDFTDAETGEKHKVSDIFERNMLRAEELIDRGKVKYYDS